MNPNKKILYPKKNNHQKFMEYIERGRFVLPYCKKCRKTIWPPADNCRLCLNNLSLKDYKNKKGKILEFFLDKFTNNTANTIMILVQLDQVILIGSLDQDKINAGNIEGKKVRMKKCGFINQKIFYRFEIVNN
ncbi:MAG TPA: zinc ribbon domain-containing protein [Nitrososphaeraceae archaeon]|nr:zinc ribbon domain-containing protein [Nitrososphaeraceae archaeon]